MPNMDLDTIIQDLNRRFAAPLPEFYRRRIIFWYDEDKEFEDKIDEIELSDAKVVKLTGSNTFEVKKLLSHDDMAGNYLVYRPFGIEKEDDDWLINIELYSEDFRADLGSIWMDEMGLFASPILHRQVRQYKRFFSAKDRRAKVAAFAKNIATAPQFHLAVMKDYMASGSFARGKEEKAASASMVFIGNINQSVDVLLKTSSLFDPFPPEMGKDTAFLDRIHCYLPGWEIPKFRPEHFTDDYGFITDYLAEFIRELRKEQYGDALDKYYHLGKNLNQRDTIAVRKMVGGFIKLLYPDGVYTKEQLEEILTISLEMRRRVKEQLKKLGGMEFYDVNFSYIDNDDFSEHYVSVPEQGGGKLIPEGMCNPGQVYTVSQGKSGMPTVRSIYLLLMILFPAMIRRTRLEFCHS